MSEDQTIEAPEAEDEAMNDAEPAVQPAADPPADMNAPVEDGTAEAASESTTEPTEAMPASDPLASNDLLSRFKVQLQPPRSQLMPLSFVSLGQ